MQLQNQVCTREQSIKLESLGIKYPDANFYWARQTDRFFSKDEKIGHSILNLWHKLDYVPAYTVAELGIMLPDGVRVKERPTSMFRSGKIAPQAIGKYGITGKFTTSADYANLIEVSPSGYDVYETWHSESGETEAQSRAAMLIYLLKNKLTAAAEINARLISQ